MKDTFKYKPSKVLKLYAATNGGSLNTRLILATAMREGKLRVKAEQRFVSHEPSLLKAWREAQQVSASQENEHQVTCSRELWWKSLCWIDDVHDWDFSRSRLVVTIQTKPLRRILLGGVRFHSLDVKRIFSEDNTSIKDPERKGFANKDRWRAFWHEIVILASGSREQVQESGLSVFKSDEKMLDLVMDRLLNDREREAGFAPDDKDLAAALSNRSPFNLGPDAVLVEIKALRQALKLKSWGKNAASTVSD